MHCYKEMAKKYQPERHQMNQPALTRAAFKAAAESPAVGLLLLLLLLLLVGAVPSW
jgi:hypothetical protein